MTWHELKIKHLKERLAFENAKKKAFRYLEERQRAILSIFAKGEKIPLSTSQRLEEERKKFNQEWSEEGELFRKLIKKQKEKMASLREKTLHSGQ